jgi:TonB-dependent starch-binding outer membrane protein SusC
MHGCRRLRNLRTVARLTGLMLAGTRVVLAQPATRELTGWVLAANGGAPVAGALLSAGASATFATTSPTGAFALQRAPGECTVVVQRVGYHSTAISVARDERVVTIILVPDSLGGARPISTGLATTIAARSSPNAVAIVGADVLNAGPTPTIEDALQAHAVGAVFQQNNGGAPGGGMQVQIRGVSSINSAAAPLYVVDGIIVNNETVNSGLNIVTAAGPEPLAQDPEDNTPNRISDLNPADIARIEVLKGASASAIYGSKGAAGVILITTKSGVDSSPRWRLTARSGTFLPANTLNLRAFPTYSAANAWWQNDVQQPGNLPVAFYNGGQNYQSQLFGGGELSGEGDVSVRGVAGSTSYFASALDKYDNGVMVHTGYRKQAGRINAGETVSKTLGLSSNLYYQHSVAVRGVTGNDNDGASPYDVFATTPQFLALNRQVNRQYVVNPFAPANPFADAALIQTPTAVTRFIGGGTLTWLPYTAPRQSVRVVVTGGADVTGQRDLNYAPASLELEQLTTAYPGVVSIDHANTQYYNGSVNIVHHFTGLRAIDATTSIGVSQDDRQIGNPDHAGIGLAPGAMLPSQAKLEADLEYRYRVRTQSLYAQEQVLTLGDRLTLVAGATSDRNAPNNMFGPLLLYPKLAAAYRVPHLSGFVQTLKFHAAYGQAGIAPTYGFNFNNAQNFYSTLVGEQRGVVVGPNANSNIYYQVADTNLRPERTTEIETGVDATMLHDRAELSVTVYQKRVNNLVMLGGSATPPLFAVNAINGGQFTNQGIELTLELSPIKTAGGFNWSVSSSFFRNYSRVDGLPNGPFAVSPEFGRFYGTYWEQVGRSVSEIVNTNVASRDGTPLQVGDAQPTFIVSAGNTVSWRRFRLYGLVDWHQGGSVINLTNAYYDNGLFLLADSAASLRRLIALGNGQTPYVEPATFVKVREITLSYELPEHWLQVGGGRVRSARISASAHNVFASFRYSGLDPEVSNFGNTAITRGQEVTPYPPVRSFFLSVDLGL